MDRKIVTLVVLLLQLSISSIFAVTKKEAQSLIENRNYVQAVVALRSLMQQSAYAKDADCNKWLGQSLCLTGHYAESLPYLQFAIRQNKKSGALWYLAISLQHLYDFEGAFEALDTYRPVLNSPFWLARADSLESEINLGMRAMEHVQDIVVIDSLLVPRATFFSFYRLGSESGRVMNGEDGIFFENQAGDYRIYSIDNELYQSHKVQDEWEELDPLPGLSSSEFQIIDPFMRSDGETIYFASDSLPGLGGLDLYKTKYNAEEGNYYQPERLGMPFNSPFDDYMLAIDETHQVGWWATERKQDPENVTIYLFLLNDDPEYLDEATVSRARIDNIAETWPSGENYSELVASIMTAEQSVSEESHAEIIISDNKKYSNKDQFTSAPALAAYENSCDLELQLEEIAIQLDMLRKEYSIQNNSNRNHLRTEILRLEELQLRLKDQLQDQVKNYRRLELQ